MLDKLNYTPLKMVSTITISGQTLAKHRWTKPERASLAARFMLGAVKIERPTVRLAASLFGISPSLVHQELKQPEYRLDNFEPQAVRDLVDAFKSATPAERLQAAKRIGVADLWDSMIAPAID
jgi:hypothetical protein